MSAAGWTTGDVVNWIGELPLNNVGQAQEGFRAHRIDGGELLRLNAQYLTEIGVRDQADCAVIMREVERMNEDQKGPNVTFELVERPFGFLLALDKQHRGGFVGMSVDEVGGHGEQQGLRKGDMIVRIGNREVASMTESEVLEAIRVARLPLKLEVHRGNNAANGKGRGQGDVSLAPARLELALQAITSCMQSALFHKSQEELLTRCIESRRQAIERMEGGIGVMRVAPWYNEKYLDPMRKELEDLQERARKERNAHVRLKNRHARLVRSVQSVAMAEMMQTNSSYSKVFFNPNVVPPADIDHLYSVVARTATTVGQKQLCASREPDSLEFLMELHADAGATKVDLFDPRVDALAVQLGLSQECVIKQPLRTPAETMRASYHKGITDFSEVCDVVRGGLVLSDLAMVARAVEILQKDSAIQIVDIENKFDPNYDAPRDSGGYRYVNTHIVFANDDPTKHVCELRLLLAPMEEIASTSRNVGVRLVTSLNLFDEAMRYGEWSLDTRRLILDGVARKVNLDFAPALPFDALCSALMDPGSHVVSLSLMGSVRTPQDNATISQYLNSRQATLLHAKLSLNPGLEDSCLASFGNCTLLQTVHLRECNVTDRGLVRLVRALVDLRDIDLHGCAGISDRGVVKLAASCPNLSRLGVSHTTVGDEGVSAIAGSCENLRVLSASSSKISDTALARVAKLRKLTHLHVENTKVTNAVLEQVVAKLPKLRELHASNTYAKDSAMRVAAEKCTALESVTMARLAITDAAVVKVVANCSRLRHLDASFTPITPEAIDFVAKSAKQVKWLGLSGTGASDAGVAALVAQCRSLETLHLANTKVTDASVVRIAQHCPAMRTLVLAGTGVGDSGARDVLAQCPALHTLVLGGTGVTNACLADVPKAANLAVLVLSGTAVDDQGVRALAQQGCARLRTIGLEGTAVSDEAVVALARACPALQALDLTATSVGDAAVLAIADACRNLQMIGLGRTRVTGRGLDKLAALSKQLQTLYLFGTGVTDASVSVLAQGCPRLQTLSLNNTAVTDAGLVSIAQHCPRMQILGLNATGITDQGLKNLESCSQLQLLEVANTNVTKLAVGALRSLLPALRVET